MKKNQKLSPRNFTKWFLLVVLLWGVIVGGAAAQEATPDPDLPMVQIIEQTEEPGAVNTIVRIFASQDSFVSNAFPNNNYGAWSTMRAGNDSSFGVTRTLVQFDFNSIPSNAIINSARLNLLLTGSVPINDGDFLYGGRYMAASWNQNSVTWSNHAADWNDNNIFGSAQVNGVSGWKSFDIRNQVSTWVSGARSNFGMAIQSSNEALPNQSRIFATNESGNRPFVDVDYTQYVDTCPPSAWFTSALNQFSLASFTVSWDGSDCGSSGLPPSGIRNYDVQYSTNNSNWINWHMDTQGRSATFNGVNGQIYFFRVRAADNALNIGPWSASINTTVDSQAPGNLNLTIGTIGATSYVYPHFQVNWSATDNLSGIQKYIVQLNDNTGSDWQSREFSSAQTSEWISGAMVGRTYTFRMQAVDNVGNVSEFTPQQNVVVVNDPISFIVPFNPSVVPGPTFNVFWQGFTSTTITQFRVRYQVDGGPWAEIPGSPFSGTQSFALFDASLLPGWTFTKATIIGFEVVATANNLPAETFTGVPEAQIIVDPNDTLTNILFMPVIFRN